jgi:hypothetical protein
MILSHKHKFIFIKGQKVAGTSVEIALAELCGPDDVITPISPHDERLRLAARNYSDDRAAEVAWLEQVASGSNTMFKGKPDYWNHMPLKRVLRQTEDLAGYQVLFVERDPYAKVLSWLNWRDHYRRGEYTGKVVSSSRQAIADAFDEEIVIVRNIDLYRLPSGEMAGPGWRYETLARDLAGFADSIGEPVPQIPHVKRGLMANTRDPREWLSDEQISVVNDVFADEFAEFGYSML